MPKFSIITPTYNRMSDGQKLARCIRSVQCQTFRDYEHIIVDDGSTDSTEEYVQGIAERDERIRYIKQKHQGRIRARNLGMKTAYDNGTQWFLWLDSDDCYDAEYLHTLIHNIRENPEAHLFVCGALVHGVKKTAEGRHLYPVWSKIRKAWAPPVTDFGCHGLFNSGLVGTGMFSYSCESFETVGLFPDYWVHHNHVADGLDEWLGVEPGSSGYSSEKKLVGNPSGDDHAYFQHLCLHYRVHLIEVALYCQYVR